jgi:hypothetical protein
MRCLCYAKFLPSGSIPLGEFFAHIGTKWTCIEDTAHVSNKTLNSSTIRNPKLPKSIVFIADCQSVKQLTTDLAKMPGAGIATLEIFPVPTTFD